MSQALPAREWLPQDWGGKADRGYMGVSMFPILGVCGGRTRLLPMAPAARRTACGDDKDGDLVAEEPLASSISTWKSTLRTDSQEVSLKSGSKK
jgi:hypothetical protein